MESVEEKFLKQNQAKPVNNEYFWLTTIVVGRNVIVKCCQSEAEAESYAYEHSLDQYKIYKCKTRNINSASQMIRGQRLNSGEKIDSVMQRYKRKL